MYKINILNILLKKPASCNSFPAPIIEYTHLCSWYRAKGVWWSHDWLTVYQSWLCHYWYASHLWWLKNPREHQITHSINTLQVLKKINENGKWVKSLGHIWDMPPCEILLQYSANKGYQKRTLEPFQGIFSIATDPIQSLAAKMWSTETLFTQVFLLVLLLPNRSNSTSLSASESTSSFADSRAVLIEFRTKWKTGSCTCN